MDLDELRGALADAARVSPPNATRARAAVGIRARVLRRRRRVFASALALACALAVVVGVVAAFGNEPTHRSVDIAPPGETEYSTLPPRVGAALASDDAHGNLVLFGGETVSAGEPAALADTWTWDGNGWMRMHPPVSPPARVGAVMSYDPETKQTVLFGGFGPHLPGETARNDTWTWDGATWTERHPEHAPPAPAPVTGSAMAFDTRSKSLLLLAPLDLRARGITPGGKLPFATWRWDGADWTEIATPAAPSYTTAGNEDHFVPLVTPLPDGVGLLFYAWSLTRRVAQTWTWDGAAWTEQHPVHSPTQGGLLATPGAGAPPLLFAPDGALWRWTGADWDRVSLPGADTKLEGAVVYDARRTQLVAYARRIEQRGDAYDTWAWDGRSWTPVNAPTATPSTTTAAPIIDPLPSGSVMLQVSNRTVSALDIDGHATGTLVTAPAGRSVTNAQLTADHRTLWYATKADDNQSCPEIVKLDLPTDTRSVVGRADDFTLTTDGSKLLLVWPYSDAWVANDCRPVPLPSGVSRFAAAFAVRDLTDGAQGAFGGESQPGDRGAGPSGRVWLSPAGDRIITTECVATCTPQTYDVSIHQIHPLPFAPAPGPACDCLTFVSGRGALYGIDREHGNAPGTRLLRFDPANLGAAGIVVLQSTDVTMTAVVPVSAGTFVVGHAPGSTRSSLYRVQQNALHLIGPLDSGTVFPIPDHVAP